VIFFGQGLFSAHYFFYMWGCERMTNKQKEKISVLRQAGTSCKEIAEQLDLSVNTVKSYCQRHELQTYVKVRNSLRLCMQCHAEIPQTPKRKAKKFCCGKCRQLWWTAHSNLIHCVSLVNHTCPVCGKTFQAYKSKHRIYCSRTCYGKSKEVTHE